MVPMRVLFQATADPPEVAILPIRQALAIGIQVLQCEAVLLTQQEVGERGWRVIPHDYFVELIKAIEDAAWVAATFPNL
jgi:hypothetical protein